MQHYIYVFIYFYSIEVNKNIYVMLQNLYPKPVISNVTCIKNYSYYHYKQSHCAMADSMLLALGDVWQIEISLSVSCHALCLRQVVYCQSREY